MENKANTINLHFSGETVNLQEFSFRKFTKLAEAYLNILRELAAAGNKTIDKKSLDFCLRSIREGSYMVDFAPIGPDTTLLDANERLQDSLESDTVGTLPAAVQDALYDMADLSVSSNVSVDLQTTSGKFIAFDAEKFIRETGTIDDFTSVYGEIVEIGGVNPNVHLQIAGRDRPLICVITKEMAIKLSSRLYTVVGFYGRASRYIANMEIKRFFVEDVLPYDDRNFDEDTAELMDYFTKHYDPERAAALFPELNEENV